MSCFQPQPINIETLYRSS